MYTVYIHKHVCGYTTNVVAPSLAYVTYTGTASSIWGTQCLMSCQEWMDDNIFKDRWSMDDFILIESVCCENGTKCNMLTTLNDFDVWFAVTNPQ